MSQVGQKVDELAGDFGATCTALNVHADDLDTVKARFAQAVEIALGGGLEVTDTQIMEPGPAPAEPTPLPTDRPATPTEQQNHAAATQAQAAFMARVGAYQQAGKIVSDARNIETASQRVLINFLEGFVDKLPFTITDFASGLAGAVAARTSKFRAAAQVASAKATRAAALMHSPNLNLRNQTRAAAIEARNSVNAAALRKQALGTRLARAVDVLPPWAKTFLTANLDLHDSVKRTTPVLGRALPVLKRVPVLGTGITAAGIGYDISQGKNAVQSTVSGVSSLAAGAAVGAAVGGPVGVIVGGVVGVGVGFVVDEWGDDIARAARGATGAVGDFFGDVF